MSKRSKPKSKCTCHWSVDIMSYHEATCPLVTPTRHKKQGKVTDIEHPERYCSEHKRTFSITEGCDDCRKAGYCPYYGRGCPC